MKEPAHKEQTMRAAAQVVNRRLALTDVSPSAVEPRRILAEAQELERLGFSSRMIPLGPFPRKLADS